jgi:hypothetical protein
MALAKMGGGIVSIKGTAGGQIYKTDKSGQHITGPQRRVKSTPSTAQKEQRAWYTSLKRGELINVNPPENPIETPRTPGISIYSMDYMIVDRQWHESGPEPVNMCKASIESPAVNAWWHRFYPNSELNANVPYSWAVDYMNANHPELVADWGFVENAGAKVLSNYYDYYNTTLGEPASVATAHAINFLETGINANVMKYSKPVKPSGIDIGVGEVGVYCAAAAFVGAALYVLANSFPLTYVGSIRFYKRRVLIVNGNYYAMGSLLGRPSKKCLDFILVGPPSAPTYTMAYDPQRLAEFECVFDPRKSVTELRRATVGWYAYTWGMIYTRWFSEAFPIYESIYRMSANEATLDFFATPIGFYYQPSDYYDYNLRMTEFWREWPEQGPRI